MSLYQRNVRRRQSKCKATEKCKLSPCENLFIKMKFTKRFQLFCQFMFWVLFPTKLTNMRSVNSCSSSCQFLLPFQVLGCLNSSDASHPVSSAGPSGPGDEVHGRKGTWVMGRGELTSPDRPPSFRIRHDSCGLEWWSEGSSALRSRC